MTHYCEVVYDQLSNRGHVIPVGNLPHYIERAQKEGVALYHSYYEFPDVFREYVEKYKSIRGYSGPTLIGKLLLDIDHCADVLERFRMVLARLTDTLCLPPELVQPWFSGRGFHITFPDVFGCGKATNVPECTRATLRALFPEADDIYDITRIVRAGQTLNCRSGLYKIPLTLEEARTADLTAVYQLAKTPRIEFVYPTSTNIPDLSRHRVLASATILPARSTETTQVITCMQKLYLRGPVVGRRNRDIVRLASAWRRSGLPLDASIQLCAQWSGLPSAEVKRTVTSVYKTPIQASCKDPIMREFCDPHCMFYKHQNVGTTASTVADMDTQYTAYLRRLAGNRVLDLADVYDLGGHYRLVPGEYVLVFGDTKRGKSAFVQNLIQQFPPDADGILPRVLYVDTEMGLPLFFRRQLQIAHGLTREAVETAYYNGEAGRLLQKVHHIVGVFRAINTEELRSLIIAHEPQLVVVDPVDDICTVGTNDIERSDITARALKHLAIQQNVVILGVQHISKMAAQGRLTEHSGKGSSTAEQKADKVIGYEGTLTSSIRQIRSLAARDEASFQITVRINKDTLQLTQLTHTPSPKILSMDIGKRSV